MLKKVLVTVMAAGALTVPLAGVAWADPGDGVGVGGVPGQIGGPPGETISQFAKMPGSVPDSISTGTGGAFRTPGGAVKDFTPGAGQGNGPQT
ncbi:hypothetical protein MLGJGCBP_07718 [Rhodococcus sp. T7]|nr:hypothetical protein MLGJGCBP_09132 [Rhodococcus sp. T7]KAF0959205.1 hypothetical protein MLGJGCBP_07718 [Rhodococcus sp. T7]